MTIVPKETPQWSTEETAEHFRSEIRARFEAHNVAHRLRDALELDAVLKEHPEYRDQPGFAVRDSFAWEVYQASKILIEQNSVTIVLPLGMAVGIELIHMFEYTTMSWSRAMVGAKIVDGHAHPTIEIVLVATWNSEMDASWRKDGNDRKRVLVELFEDEPIKMSMLLDAFSGHTVRHEGRVHPLFTDDEAKKLRERLVLSLDAMP